MTCHEINNLLPAFLEDLLPPEEKKSIKSHLASCIICYRSLEDLKRAEDLVKGLEEVEPPPFFEQRIMARVREEAGQKKGFLRKFFYPLYIKIPIQAMTMLLVAVLAFYVYQKNEPDMKQQTPFPIPLNESGKGQILAKSPKALDPPSAVTPDGRAPAGDLPEKEQQSFAASPFEQKGKGDRANESAAPISEERPSAIKSGAPFMAAREKEGPPARAEGLDKAQDRAGKQETGKAIDTLLTEQKRNEKPADAGARAEERRAMKSAPALSRLSAAADKNRSAINLTIQVRDTVVAVREIEEGLNQVNGRIIDRLDREGRGLLKVEIAAQKIAAFLDRLEAVGKVNLDKNTFDFPEGKVTVSIQIFTNP
jgi:hypothetical protein